MGPDGTNPVDNVLDRVLSEEVEPTDCEIAFLGDNGEEPWIHRALRECAFSRSTSARLREQEKLLIENIADVMGRVLGPDLGKLRISKEDIPKYLDVIRKLMRLLDVSKIKDMLAERFKAQ